jgi:hypothetical protein
MRNDVQRYLDLLERHLGVLRLLADALRQSRQAFVGMNLGAIQQYTADQENLCAEIRFLNQEMEEVKHKLAVEFRLDSKTVDLKLLARQLDPDTARRLRLLLNGLESIQADVRRLNRVQAELLRRSRRSINVLMNLVANCQATCPPPSLSPGLSPATGRQFGGLGHV